MAVTKRHPVEAAEWALEGGLRHLGENRVQELAEKRPKTADKRGQWELIGPLQRNKARLAIQHADRIQTVERIKLVRALDRICGEEGRERLPVLMQVNVSGDPAKSGCDPEGAGDLLRAITGSAHLELEGLMTIGELTDDRERIRATFRELRELRDRLSGETGLALPVLSMGMTGDLEIAIEEGSTLIRVGTALFGEREPAG
ncbi:MAG: YggS family pyridoxal phosphate-dependent enzyme [Oceanipulchritudo sp.]